MDHRAECYCGEVALVVEGDPVLQCFCHCRSCRRWSGQPVTACLLWPEDRVRFVRGRERMLRFSITEHPEGGKFSCRTCGGAICTFLPKTRLYDVFHGVLVDFDFRPAMHINYAERVLSMPDGLPKFRDMPERSGGTGTLIGE
ncbi:GFA family protein [Thalassococcus sp. CAU 1522]|uniref:GFA family protein n=1 Tax=Thalassococcus arenae TaxID=2851652 RepID=A0ABS6NA10_9RHOB|nr:GFA family protein [Thalassococcus arenae]MBV2360375.1 GFA family protein [Thalassococcus arenae]